MSQPERAHSFYTERIPNQFNRALEKQRALGEGGARMYQSMVAVDVTFCVIVEGGGTFYLNVSSGRMEAADHPARPPLFTLVHDVEAMPALERTTGDSALSLLGGLAGLGEMKLTSERLRNLEDVSGAIRFEVLGEGGFAILTHFGRGPIPEVPDCSIQVEPETHLALQNSELSPQEAFMSGAVRVEGDMQLAMELALAAFEPNQEPEPRDS